MEIGSLKFKVKISLLVYILTILAFLSLAVPSMAQDAIFYHKANDFFKNYVDEGLVDYEKIKNRKSDLEDLKTIISKTDLDGLIGDEKSAFLINTYNILVIDGIVRKYPTKSPLKINGFFDAKIFNVGGEELSLNQVEKEILFKHKPDARLHFVLVCAAVSCPKLASFAYLPKMLEEQLESQTRLVLNDREFIRQDKDKVLFSEIFNWYSNDFRKAAGSSLKYVNKYRTTPFDPKSKTGFYTYDWTLNDLK